MCDDDLSSLGSADNPVFITSEMLASVDPTALPSVIRMNRKFMKKKLGYSRADMDDGVGPETETTFFPNLAGFHAVDGNSNVVSFEDEAS